MAWAFLAGNASVGLRGARAGSVIPGEGSSHDGSANGALSPSQHYPGAVANSDESYARKFGHYGQDSAVRCACCLRACAPFVDGAAAMAALSGLRCAERPSVLATLAALSGAARKPVVCRLNTTSQGLA